MEEIYSQSGINGDNELKEIVSALQNVQTTTKEINTQVFSQNLKKDLEKLQKIRSNIDSLFIKPQIMNNDDVEKILSNFIKYKNQIETCKYKHALNDNKLAEKLELLGSKENSLFNFGKNTEKIRNQLLVYYPLGNVSNDSSNINDEKSKNNGYTEHSNSKDIFKEAYGDISNEKIRDDFTQLIQWNTNLNHLRSQIVVYCKEKISDDKIIEDFKKLLDYNNELYEIKTRLSDLTSKNYSSFKDLEEELINLIKSKESFKFIEEKDSIWKSNFPNIWNSVETDIVQLKEAYFEKYSDIEEEDQYLYDDSNDLNDVTGIDATDEYETSNELINENFNEVDDNISSELVENSNKIANKISNEIIHKVFDKDENEVFVFENKVEDSELNEASINSINSVGSVDTSSDVNNIGSYNGFNDLDNVKGIDEYNNDNNNKYDDDLNNEIIDYKFYEANNKSLDFHNSSFSENKGIIVDIIKIESPVHVDEVFERVKTVYCHEVSEDSEEFKTFKSAVNGLIYHLDRNNEINMSNDFCFDVNTPNVPIRLRENPNIQIISNEEIKQTILKTLESKKSLYIVELAKSASKLLGFKFVSPIIKNKYLEVSKIMVENKELNETLTDWFELVKLDNI